MAAADEAARGALLTPLFEPTDTCSLEGSTETKNYLVLSALVSCGPYHRVRQVLGTDGSSELSKDLRGWDTDGSGAIGFEEFKQLMKAAVPPPPEESLAAESF